MAQLTHDERMAALTVASVYPHYVTKAEKKGYGEAELLEEIENPLTQQVRYLDKLVDELGKGKAMEKILRS